MLPTLLSLLGPAALVLANLPDGRFNGSQPPMPLPPKVPSLKTLGPLSTSPEFPAYYFDQLIDHSNPGLGTFQMRYWIDWEFYEEGSLSRTRNGVLLTSLIRWPHCHLHSW
jgi:hypothetical protein